MKRLKDEWSYPMATFVACCLVTVLNFATAVRLWTKPTDVQALEMRIKHLESLLLQRKPHDRQELGQE